MLFWRHYRRTFVPIQTAIAVACLAFVLIGHADWGELGKPLIVMEAGALFGAAVAARIKASAMNVGPAPLKPLTHE